MDAELIYIGSDMLIGDGVSESQGFLATELADLDIRLRFVDSAPAEPVKLREIISMALRRSQIILLVGGIEQGTQGVAKRTVSEALGVPMVRDEATARRIESYCQRKGVAPGAELRGLADIPSGAEVFGNRRVLCPGLAIRSHRQCIIMLPPGRAELPAMCHNSLLPYLRRMTGVAVVSRTVNIFRGGMNAEAAEQRLGELARSVNPKISCLDVDGEVRVRVTGRASSDEAAQDLVKEHVRKILFLFGKAAYGVNVSGLEAVVVRGLLRRRMTVATAESCTAGLISKRITDIPGASEVFEMGASTYSNDQKAAMLGVPDRLLRDYGEVSPEVAAAMAIGALRLAGSALAVSTTGLAGPGGGSPEKPVGLVYIALADRERVWIRRVMIRKPGADREYIRRVASSHALNLIRLYLRELPGRLPGGEPHNAPHHGAHIPPMPPQRNAAAALIPRQNRPGNIPGHYGKPKAKKNKSSAAPLLFLLLIAVFLIPAGVLLYNLVIDPYLTEKSYNPFREAKENIAVEDTAARNPDGTLQWFNDIREINSDVVGWVTIPNTAIDYPVVKYTDDDFYLNNNIEKKKDKNGAIYALAETDIRYGHKTPVFVLIGHHMKSGSMFQNLMKYDVYANKNAIDFYKENSTVTFNTIYDEGEWVIFSVMKLNTLGIHDNGNYFKFDQLVFDNEEAFKNHIAEIRARSIIDTASCIDVLPSDQLLALVTCSYEYDDFRTVVVARKLRPGEAAPDVSVAKQAVSPLMPAVWSG